MRALVRWRRLPARERWLVVQAVVALLVLPSLLRRVGLRRAVAALRCTPPRRGAAWVPARVTALVESVALHLPWPTTCLHRSVAAAWLMGRRGVTATLTIGVQGASDAFAAHAWLEYADASPTDAEGAYTRLITWQVGPGPSSA